VWKVTFLWLAAIFIGLVAVMIFAPSSAPGQHPTTGSDSASSGDGGGLTALRHKQVDTDSSRSEAIDYFNPAYNTAGTGGQNVSPPPDEEQSTRRVIDLNVANTGRAKATLFWTAPSSVAGFYIYRSDTYGHLGSKITRRPVYPPNTKAGLTDSFLYSDTGLTVGNSYFYTVKAVDRRHHTLYTSSQEEFEAASSGFAWDAPDPRAAMTELRNDLNSRFPEDRGEEEFTFVGPDNISYERHADGSVTMYPPSDRER
jgi:hypothetical protein